MFGLTSIITASSCLFFHFGAATVVPVKKANNFTFKTPVNHAVCPMAGGMKFSTPNGDHFGILCGWDTHSRSFKYGPLYNISFEECVHECTQKGDCNVATYTGTCYLNESAKGQGLVRAGRKNNMSAIKLPKAPKKDDGKGGKDGSGGKGSKPPVYGDGGKNDNGGKGGKPPVYGNGGKNDNGGKGGKPLGYDDGGKDSKGGKESKPAEYGEDGKVGTGGK